MISSALSSGVMGVQLGMQRLDSSAQEIARQSMTAPDTTGSSAGSQAGASRPASPTGDVTEPLIEQRQALYQAQAGAKVIQAANQTLGTLLDAFA